MRILQIHTQYREPGGEDTVAATEAAILEAAGHEVIEHRAHNPVGSTAAAWDMARAPWNASAAKSIGELVDRHEPDVTHVHNTWFHLSPAIFQAIRASGSPVVLTLHNYRLVCPNALMLRDGAPCDLCVVSRSTIPAVRYRCYRNSYLQSSVAAATVTYNRRRQTWDKDVDLILALTEFARTKMIEGGLPAERIIVKPNFVQDPGPRQMPVEDSDTVLFVGRLTPDKGPDVLLDAWERAAPTDIRLKVVGGGELEETLRGRDVPGVTVEGPLPRAQVQKEMLSARALILPSIWFEGLSMVMLEALAAGLPVMASALGAMPQVLQPLGDPWLIPPNNMAVLADGLRLLCENEHVAAAGETARRLYEKSYSPISGLEGLEAAYQRAAGPISDQSATAR